MVVAQSVSTLHAVTKKRYFDACTSDSASFTIDDSTLLHVNTSFVVFVDALGRLPVTTFATTSTNL